MESFHSYSPKNQDFVHQQAGNQIVKNALVIHDNVLLFDIIRTNLTQIPLKISGIGPKLFTDKTESEIESVDPDLIIIAMRNSSRWEPIIFLFHTTLIDLVGKIPFLIVTDRKFDSDDEGKIFHLNYPLDVGELRQTVQTILDVDDDQTGSRSQ